MESIDDIVGLFERFGDQRYGEEVTQLEHALQAATLAQQSGAGIHLVAAALLHDVGHFLADGSNRSPAEDLHHERLAARWLAPFFGDAVIEPIRLHVDAKRYRCATEASYFASLSEASRLSLALQGGPMDAKESAIFRAHPWSRDALLLRQWDDLAKIPNLKTPPLADFLPTLQAARNCV